MLDVEKRELKMSITLATTWYPRGEFSRFVRCLPLLEENYARIVICCIPGDDPSVAEQFTTGQYSSDEKILFFLNEYKRNGRYLAIQKALETSSDFIHYVDMDRLLRWVETNPQEWLQMVAQVEQADCLIFGRTPAALRTHPHALINTELVSNRVVSHMLGLVMDVSAGSKSFSRQAAQYLVEHGNQDNSIGTDAEWPIMLKRAGFTLQYVLVNGLDYESADQFKPRSATPEEQQQAAARYDADPQHWSTRVDIADQIITTALDVSGMDLPVPGEVDGKKENFDLQAVFDVDDYLYFYRESLTDERTDSEVSALVSLLELNQPMRILDLACGFGRHANRLAALGHTLTGIDLTSGFLDIARRDAAERKVNVDYQQGDMRTITFDNEFDRVMLLFTAFGYFTDEQNQQVLVNVSEALKPGGLLVFDAPNRDALLKDMRPFYVMEKEGNLMIDRMSFEGQTGKYYNRRIVIRAGVRRDKPYFVRLYNPSEIKSLLAQAGLELYHLYAGWEGKEYTSDTRRMLVLARKPV